MGGFDNGSLQGGVFSQAKQFGSILRGLGPPVPEAGVKGDLYLDTQTWLLYHKRSDELTDPWGHFLFQVPAAYQSSLKWFATSPITDDVGILGDYALAWAGGSNYGLQPSIYGPKALSGWPHNGNGPATQIDPAFAGTALQVGLTAEGPALAFSTSTQLIVTGLATEYILSVPTALVTANSPVLQQGVQSGAGAVAVTLGTLYTAEDGHSQPTGVIAVRLPAHAASVPILASDVYVGIDTGTAPTSCPLPDAGTWAATNPGGLELDIFDFTGHAPTNNITFVLSGTDVFTQGIAPVIADNFGHVKLLPVITGGVNQWFVQGVG